METRINIVEHTQRAQDTRLSQVEKEMRELGPELGIIKKDPPPLKQFEPSNANFDRNVGARIVV
eukprot:6875408-Pyramimonas_sp.AAC.1